MNPQQAISTVSKALNVAPLTAERMTFTHSGNSVYSVELPDRAVILRASPKKNPFDYTERNLETMCELGLPVPRVLASGCTDIPEQWSYIILEKLPGRDLYYELESMSRSQVTSLAEQIVSFQTAVATLPVGPGYGWGQIGEGGGDQTWFYIFRNVAEVNAPESDGNKVTECRIRIHQLQNRMQPYLRSIKPTCFLDDLTTKNVLIEDGRLTGIVDIDFVCFGDPLWTIGATAGCIASDIGLKHLFYFEELCRCSGVTEEQQQAVNLYASIRALEFLEMAVRDDDQKRASRLIKAIEMWTQR